MSINSGHSHSFDVGVAKTLGLNAAVIFNHIVYWLRINAAKGHNIKEGKVWMYEKQQEIADFLEYLSLDDVKKAMVKLIDSGLLIKGNFNSNPFDKTGWYTTSDQNIILVKKSNTKVPNGTIGSAKRHDPGCHLAPCIIQEEQQEDNIVCIADANGPDKKEEKKETSPQMQMIRRIDRKTGRGDPISIGWDELITYATNHKKDWRLTEMKEAWQILHNREGFVNDMIEFIGGTITNLRTKTRVNYANQGKQTCKSQQTSKPRDEMKNSPDTSKSNSENSSEKGIRVNVLDALISLRQQLGQSLDGLPPRKIS